MSKDKNKNPEPWYINFVGGIILGAITGTMAIGWFDTILKVARGEDAPNGNVILFSLFSLTFFHLFLLTKEFRAMRVSRLLELMNSKTFLFGFTIIIILIANLRMCEAGIVRHFCL